MKYFAESMDSGGEMGYSLRVVVSLAKCRTIARKSVCIGPKSRHFNPKLFGISDLPTPVKFNSKGVLYKVPVRRRRR